jgi:hypothetical protein
VGPGWKNALLALWITDILGRISFSLTRASLSVSPHSRSSLSPERGRTRRRGGETLAAANPSGGGSGDGGSWCWQPALETLAPWSKTVGRSRHAVEWTRREAGLVPGRVSTAPPPSLTSPLLVLMLIALVYCATESCLGFIDYVLLVHL